MAVQGHGQALFGGFLFCRQLMILFDGQPEKILAARTMHGSDEEHTGKPIAYVKLIKTPTCANWPNFFDYHNKPSVRSQAADVAVLAVCVCVCVLSFTADLFFLFLDFSPKIFYS